ncbi:hypothetical protein X470_01139, partial [Bartonella bacilliformis Peru-18]
MAPLMLFDLRNLNWCFGDIPPCFCSGK